MIFGRGITVAFPICSARVSALKSKAKSSSPWRFARPSSTPKAFACWTCISIRSTDRRLWTDWRSGSRDASSEELGPLLKTQRLNRWSRCKWPVERARLHPPWRLHLSPSGLNDKSERIPGFRAIANAPTVIVLEAQFGDVPDWKSFQNDSAAFLHQRQHAGAAGVPFTVTDRLLHCQTAG